MGKVLTHMTMANGWKDNHPAGARVVVVTHSPPEDAAETWLKTTFVDGVEAAITQAKQIATADPHAKRVTSCRFPGGNPAVCDPFRRMSPSRARRSSSRPCT